jgi:FKBP-type peptidyl-prolyl cis-trans isomerase
MKKLTTLSVILCSLLFSACNADAAKTASAAPADPVTEEQKTAYSIGLLLSQSIKTFDLTPEELVLVQKGITDGVKNTQTTIKAEDYIPKIQALQMSRLTAAGTAFLEKASKDTGATKTASGLVIKTVKEGTGAQPAATDHVKVHYEGRLIDGKVFDSSIARGEPATFPLNGVIGCWTEGVQTMKVGGKAQLTCPYELAYGPGGNPPNIPPYATLVFDVELLDIEKPAAAKPTK